MKFKDIFKENSTFDLSTSEPYGEETFTAPTMGAPTKVIQLINKIDFKKINTEIVGLIDIDEVNGQVTVEPKYENEIRVILNDAGIEIA